MKKIDPIEVGTPGEPVEPVVGAPVTEGGIAGIPKQTLFIVGGLVALIGIGLLVFFTTR